MICLASSSPRRRALLKRLCNSFEVHPVDADERPPAGVPPEHAPLILSQRKASLCAEQRSGDVVIAADTVVVKNDQLIGKPEDPAEARERLKQLRNGSHQVVTGVTARRAGGSAEESMTCVSKVTIRNLSDEEIETYVSSGKPLDRAGGYGIQDREFHPVESVSGCPANVMGLPICMIPELLDAVDADVPSSSVSNCRPNRESACALDQPLSTEQTS